MVNSDCLIKRNVKASVLESSNLEYFWSDHLSFSLIFMGICLIVHSSIIQNASLTSEIGSPSFLLSMFLHCSDMLLTVFLEALIPLDTEAIVFCKQILTRIFREALWCYRYVPEMLPAYELRSVISCPYLKSFAVLSFLFLFPPCFFYEALNDSGSWRAVWINAAANSCQTW